MGKNSFARTYTLVVVGVAVVALFVVGARSYFITPAFTIDMFDIGQGDAILITTPTRERILVDGGPDASVVAKLSRRLGFFNRTIDLVIATHPQADHVSGLVPVLKRFTVGRVLLTGIRNETPEYKALREAIASAHITTSDAADVPVITLGEAKPVTLEVLWPSRAYGNRLIDDPNIVSTVFRLTYGDTRFLFTGDSTVTIEQELLKRDIDLSADVLKVGHHGSDTSTTQDFLDAVAPSVALISVGRENRFGHPSRRVLKRLERAGAAVYRTDLRGDIRVTSDGKKIRISTQLGGKASK